MTNEEKEEKEAIEIVKQIERRDLLNCWDYGEQEYKALQILLNLIENQQKQIEKLQEENILFLAKEGMFDYMFYKENYIPKSKIEEKIEEIKNQGNSKYCKYVTYRTRNDFIVEKYGLIDVLQELLESEE